MAVERSFAKAAVRPESYVRGPDDTGILVFIFETDSLSTLFEGHLRWAENGNDFWQVIVNFGLDSKFSAGSREPKLQKPFSQREIEAIERRLKEFFTGYEEKNFSPFHLKKGHCLGVEFPSGWIVQKKDFSNSKGPFRI